MLIILLHTAEAFGTHHVYVWCEGVVVPEGVREGTQGYQLHLETVPVLDTL